MIGKHFEMIDHPLHVRTLQELHHEFEGGFHPVFYLSLAIGSQETNSATQAEHLIAAE